MTKVRDEDALKKFGKYLKQLRKERKISQESLAWSAGLEYSQISRIERGLINTTLSTLLIIASTLEIEPSELLKVFDSSKK